MTGWIAWADSSWHKCGTVIRRRFWELSLTWLNWAKLASANSGMWPISMQDCHLVLNLNWLTVTVLSWLRKQRHFAHQLLAYPAALPPGVDFRNYNTDLAKLSKAGIGKQQHVAHLWPGLTEQSWHQQTAAWDPSAVAYPASLPSCGDFRNYNWPGLNQ